MRPIQWHFKNNWSVPESLEKVIPIPRSLHPHLQCWQEEENVLQGQSLHPVKHALLIFTDASKEGWGTHLNEHTARGTWSLLESNLHINYLELKAVFLALKEFQDLCSDASDSQSPTHSRPVECGSKQAIQARPDHPLASAVDALSVPWEDLGAYAFPPAAILGKVVEKLQDSPCKRFILIAPGWQHMPWFWDLVAMSSQIPLSLSNMPNLLTQPFNQIPHRNLTNLNLHAYLLEPQQSRNRVSLRQWQQELRLNVPNPTEPVQHAQPIDTALQSDPSQKSD